MGGKGGRKKQSPKAPIKAVVAKAAPKAAAPKRAAPSGDAGKPPMAEVVKVGSAVDPASDYSDAEEAVKPMQLDAGTSAALKRQLKAAERSLRPTTADAGVLYLGHIPHGFYEEQMKGFFSQFGTVSRLRLARNKKTGRSKHYAFIEFKDADVGGIVARAMDGYLLFSKLLVAKVLPPESVHPEMFKGAHRAFRVIDTAAVRRQQHNKPRTADQAGKREQQLVKAEGKKRKKLAAAGIDYEFGGYAAEAEQPNRKRVRGVQTTMPTAQDDGEEDALIVEKAMAALKAPKKQSAKQLNEEEEEKAAPPKKAAKGKKRAAAEEEEAPPPAKPPAPAAASKKAKTKK